MAWDCFVFDFDGTLADTGDGVTASVSYALEKMAYPPLNKAQLRSFIGPSLYSSFTATCLMSDGEAVEAINHYREFYIREGVYRCHLYEGMNELLVKLASRSKVSVASAKPQLQLDMAAAHLGVDKYACRIVGADPSVKSNDKADLLRRAMLSDNSVMIGDSIYDIRAGKELGIATVAVSYGFTSEDELLAEKPDFLAKTVAELEEILIKNCK